MATITILMRKKLRASFDEKEIKSHPTTIASKECGVKKMVSFHGCCSQRKKHLYFVIIFSHSHLYPINGLNITWVKGLSFELSKKNKKIR